jgi:exodeoxyribonuclease VII small subunit
VTEPRPPRIDLEKALSDLESIVSRLEAGDMPLEKSLKEFERGVKLSRECQAALRDAEKKVQVLVGKDLQAFGAGEDEPDEDADAEDGDED